MKISVLYFMTTGWSCGACHGQFPHVTSVCKDMGVDLVSVDISKSTPDELGIIGEEEGIRYNICGLPTVVVLRDGQEVGRIESGLTRQIVADLIRSAKED